MDELSVSEVLEGVLKGHRYNIPHFAYGIEIQFTLSYVSQVSKWRIDVHVNETLVMRNHYDTPQEFVEQLEVIGLK